MGKTAEVEIKSAGRLAFAHYLRTGQRISEADINLGSDRIEAKFNPYHDPRNGRFTFAPGGPRSLSRLVTSSRSDISRVATRFSQQAPSKINVSNAVYWPDGPKRGFQLTAGGNPPRPGGNSRAFQDPMTLQQVFPSLGSSPAGAIVSVAENFFDFMGPANRLTTELTRDYSNFLINQIRAVDPNYRFDSFGVPTTAEGQANQIRKLRLDRAAALYRVRGEVRPLQVETLRFLQDSVDTWYARGLRELKAGKLTVRLSPEEAIGNYVDLGVRRDLRMMLNGNGIANGKGRDIRVVGREYDTSGTDTSFRIRDARVGKIAFDVTLTRKTLSTRQVRGFFDSDFKPDAVVIVRPTDLGSNSTYLISRPVN